MGGRGGGTLGNLERLEEVAKKALEQKRRNIFISFAYEDIDNVNLLRGQAKNERNDIDFIDRSVHSPFDSTRADYIRGRLEDRINQASMTVVYVSDNTPSSNWVSWEVEKSLELGKQVVAVHPGDNPPKKLPDWVRKYDIKVVPWNKLAGEIE